MVRCSAFTPKGSSVPASWWGPWGGGDYPQWTSLEINATRTCVGGCQRNVWCDASGGSERLGANWHAEVDIDGGVWSLEEEGGGRFSNREGPAENGGVEC